ncbi:Gfo/Idh/MocA family protein [Jannaschia sp. M317]|uniref:Gfo/Idh/MocA family protein n=1 Tax=Jannaschia sp. M317 TaxID=2867011 RepID=UPI0021A50AD2|nr:Gfo/Idh/MocA family oxidoreductase [Jannaschia sp. M317]UWQ16192.1 Gfo/Idh/MocA family oxidoreductase [Jannaschia sp. M317]
MTLRIAALGLDHRHIYGMSQGMLDAGATWRGYWTDGAPAPLAGFVERHPDVPRCATVAEALDGTDLALIAAAPADRARLSIDAMEAGCDVMLDKPGCLTAAELAEVRAVQARTGRIWSVNFSERFEVPSTTLADRLLAQGAIGRLIALTSQAPHRLNAHMRPDWFWDAPRYGGIIGDIGTHQIDQFLHYAGTLDAKIVHASATNLATPDRPRFQDFGEILLQAGDVRGYARLDWFTPDALPTWGDGRLTLLGTEGYIELRKYVDVGRAGTDHVVLVNKDTCETMDAADAGLPYFTRLAADVRDRTETAVAQTHTFRVMELAIEAQRLADAGRGS